ncbi:MAG TPA: EAL domain-containing protein [Acidimicrobiales bacterium]|nr:EAL domain-containing protein [Acidimicrobiales bacterium]
MGATVTVGGAVGAALVAVGLVAVWLANVAVGGANTVPPHGFYVPILVAGIRFGARGAAVTSVTAGVLAGPLLPADVSTATAQPLSDWLVRVVFFVVLGQVMTGIVALTVRELRARLEQLQAEHELALALERGELFVLYQPIVSLDAQPRIVGVEALLRWRHPQRGDVLPGDFIPLAEQSGLIVSIGRWVLHEACRQAQQWRRDILRDADSFKIAVNVSTRQLNEAQFPGDVSEILAATGLPPSWLHLEVTETALVVDIDWSAEQLQRVKQVGVSVAVDDFGTGYASLTYVQRFPIDVIKIDRSFVATLETDPGGGAIAGGIVMLARSLGIRTVAEGVETARQADMLRDLGCDLAQGWFFGRPKPAVDIERLLRTQQDSAYPEPTLTVAHLTDPSPSPASTANEPRR